MFTPVSVRNLLDAGRQTVISIAGICFAIILIFMQLGFLGAVLDTAVLFYNNLKFDLIARSPDYYHFADAKVFPREFLYRIKNVEGVDAVQPYHVNLGKWNYTEKSVQRGMLVMGVDFQGVTYSSKDPNVVLPDVKLLTNDHFLLVDTKSNPDFLGFGNSQRFSEKDIGLRIELSDNECTVAGLFKLGTGLAANGAVVLNEQGFQRVFENYGPDRVALGLIQLNPASAQNLEATRKLIYRSLGLDPDVTVPTVEVLTKSEAVQRERRHWVFNTPVGFIFFSGVLISLVVGAIIVYIVLSADITGHIAEYATLKAMGYRNGFLYRVVLEQAMILGVVSFSISVPVSLFLYKIVGDAANLPIIMTLTRELTVFGFSVLMCCLSSAIAMQKLRKADPADLF
jgi:putative ABC transport system permease protein